MRNRQQFIGSVTRAPKANGEFVRFIHLSSASFLSLSLSFRFLGNEFPRTFELDYFMALALIEMSDQLFVLTELDFSLSL